MSKGIPLIPYEEHPVKNVIAGSVYPGICVAYREIGSRFEKDGLREQMISRFDFYDRAKQAYALVATGETALYANIILKKGVVKK